MGGIKFFSQVPYRLPDGTGTKIMPSRITLQDHHTGTKIMEVQTPISDNHSFSMSIGRDLRTQATAHLRTTSNESETKAMANMNHFIIQ